jgi:hypothetical protein
MKMKMKMRPSGTFSDPPFKSFRSLKMTCLKMKYKNRSVFCDLRFAISYILTSTGRHLFNCYIIGGHYPAFFKVARVRPVFKGEDPTEFSNYRLVSVLLSFSRCLEGPAGNAGGVYGPTGSDTTPCSHRPTLLFWVL